MNRDSTDKILGYLDAVRVGGKPLRLGPTLLRGYTCPERCGGCCASVFTLDYLPGEDHPEGVEPREVRGVTVYTDKQQGHKGKHCRRLDLATGRCTIHGRHPFSCDFELVRFNIFAERYVPNQVAVRLYGRGWNMLRVDGERGAQCEITPPTEETIADVRRKFARLEQWAKHFGIPTRIPVILEWLDSSDHKVTVI